MILFPEAVASMGFLMGEYSGSMRQVCKVASMMKCDFNNGAMQLCWGHT